MAKYKLTKKRNSLNPKKDGLWYAEPKAGSTMETQMLCKMVTKHTTLSHIELSMGLEMLGDRLPDIFAQGRPVQLGNIGSLQVTYGSEGVAEPEDFSHHLIRTPRLVFRPNRRFLKSVLEKMSYQLDGVAVDGLVFGDIESFRKWEGSSTSAEGGTS